MLIVEIRFLAAGYCRAILLVQGTRRIPITYAKRIVGNNNMVAPDNTYLCK